MSDQKDNENANAPENREPTANSRVTPAVPFVVLVSILWGGMTYFDSHGGNFNGQVYARNLNHAPPVLGLSPAQEQLLKGKGIYTRNCSACHQPSGGGVPGQFPPLAGSDWVNGVGPNRIIRLVLDGITGPIEVNGNAFNSAMVPWRPMMSDEEIAAVVAYIRNEAEWGNSDDGVFIKPSLVKSIRGATSGHAGQPYSADELLGLPDAD